MTFVTYPGNNVSQENQRSSARKSQGPKAGKKHQSSQRRLFTPDIDTQDIPTGAQPPLPIDSTPIPPRSICSQEEYPDSDVTLLPPARQSLFRGWRKVSVSSDDSTPSVLTQRSKSFSQANSTTHSQVSTYNAILIAIAQANPKASPSAITKRAKSLFKETQKPL